SLVIVVGRDNPLATRTLSHLERVHAPRVPGHVTEAVRTDTEDLELEIAGPVVHDARYLAVRPLTRLARCHGAMQVCAARALINHQALDLRRVLLRWRPAPCWPLCRNCHVFVLSSLPDLASGHLPRSARERGTMASN